MSVKNDIPIVVEIIKNRLYWTNYQQTNQENSYSYCSDNEFNYHAFFNDYGPIDINQTYKFCIRLNGILQEPGLVSKKIFHSTSNRPYKKVNSAYLMGAYCIIVLKKAAYEVTRLFEQVKMGFRDALEGQCDYICSLGDCFDGLEQAIRRGWFNFAKFSSPDYEFYSKNDNGDLNWIVPSQFLASKCPSCLNSVNPRPNSSILKYIQTVKKLGITTVIRLNNPEYPSEILKQNGLHHYDMYFKDGSVPPIDLVNQFIEVCISERGAVGVHCKAGLGRTGTLIGCYAIKIFKFPAASFIAWCRLCRPGSILGPQQQFLIDYELSVRKKSVFSLNISNVNGYKALHGDYNQAKKLIEAKNKRENAYENKLIGKNHSRQESNNSIGAWQNLIETEETPKISENLEVQTTASTQKNTRISNFCMETNRIHTKMNKRSNSSLYSLAGKNLRSLQVMKILYSTPTSFN
ncbi:hypothetical protein SteCoe_22102 [Stentor coeruleus]|uniref:protein-tyrosine-phosphatase n=1 Tax=Stentor coeruleus TaxID=5963 RepID=A0A1R2BN39_9CILI|nr:hypothetical protein SteCoe_22102 [Stentor coeruleus]